MEFQDFQRQINKADLSKILDEGILDRASRLWDNNLPEFEKIIHILQTNLLNFDAPFVFYGAGTLTEKIFSQLSTAEFKSLLIAFVDANAETNNFSQLPAPVYSIKYLQHLKDNKLILCHPWAEPNMYRSAKENGVPDENIICIFTGKESQNWLKNKSKMILTKQKQIIEDIKKELSPNKKTLIYINANGSTIIQPEILSACKIPSFNIFHLRLSQYTHMIPPVKECAYDFECGSSLRLCLNLIEYIAPDVFYINDNGILKDQVAPLIKIAFPSIPYIYEPYDSIVSVYSDPSSSSIGMAKQDIDYLLSIENYLFQQSDLIIHNDDGEPIRQLLKKHSAKHLHFQSYMGMSDLRFQPKQQLSNNIHLVFAGSVLPNETAAGVHCSLKLLPFFKTLIRQEFKLSVYVSNAKNTDDLEKTFHEFLNLANTNPKFHVYHFMPRKQLISEISIADFGLHIFPLPKDDSSHQAMYETSMASKVQTYIAAGLPIITGNFLKPIAKIVDKNQIGICLDDDEIKNLFEIVKNCDFKQMKKNIRLVQKNTTWQAHLGELESFLQKAI